MSICSIANAAQPCKDELTARGIFGLNDYTMNADGLEFNPAGRFIRHGKKVVQLSPVNYQVLENIVFGEKPFARADFERMHEEMFGSGDKDLDPLYLNTVVHRLQKTLKKNFGKEIAARMVTLPSLGFIWLDTPNLENIRAEKFWFHPEKNYLYYESTYVHIPPSLLVILQTLKETSCRPKSLDYLQAQLDRAGLKGNLNHDTFKRQRGRLKDELGKHLKGKPIIRIGADYWALNPALFAGCPPRLIESRPE